MNPQELDDIIDKLHDTMMNRDADDATRHMARMLRDMLPAWTSLAEEMRTEIVSANTHADKALRSADVHRAMTHTMAKMMLVMTVAIGPGGPPPSDIVDWIVEAIGTAVQHEAEMMQIAWEKSL